MQSSNIIQMDQLEKRNMLKFAKNKRSEDVKLNEWHANNYIIVSQSL